MSLVSLPFEMDDMLITKQEIYQERQNFNFLAFHALVAVCVLFFPVETPIVRVTCVSYVSRSI